MYSDDGHVVPCDAARAFRARGEAGRGAFGRVALACGLPACAGPVLFRAVMNVCEAVDEVTPPPSPPGGVDLGFKKSAAPAKPPAVSGAAFGQYWAGRLRGLDGEGKLWNVFVDAEEVGMDEGGFEELDVSIHRLLGGRKEAREDGLEGLKGADRAIGNVVKAFMLGRRGRVGLFSRVPEPVAVLIATGGVLASLRAAGGRAVAGVVKEVGVREMRKGEFCRVMREAEDGVFLGAGKCLSMEAIVSISEAQKIGVSGLGLGVKACEEVVRVAGRGRELTHDAFAVLCESVADPGGIVAREFWFTVIDGDGNGAIGCVDVHDLYRGKKVLLERKGIISVSSHGLWRGFCDRIGADCVDRAAWRKMLGAERAVLVKSVLFVNDGGLTLSMRFDHLELAER